MSLDNHTTPEFPQCPGAAKTPAVRGGGMPCPDEIALASYVDGMATPDEVGRIERHVNVCPACREAVELARLCGEEPLPLAPAGRTERVREAIRAALEQEKASGGAARVVSATGEASSPAGRGRPRRARRLLLQALAACLVFGLMVAAGAIAGPRLMQGLARLMDSRRTAAPEVSEDAHQVAEVGVPASADAAAAGSTRGGGDVAGISLDVSGLVISDDEFLEEAVHEAAARAELEALLPKTEEQWEAWARREYPHVMWVYDLLTQPEYGVEWDGEPVHVPAWTRKVWPRGVPEYTGWRALLCYSGEILRLDRPVEPDKPLVQPSITAIRAAAAVAGYGLDVGDGAEGWPLPRLGYSDFPGHTDNGARCLFAELADTQKHAIESVRLQDMDPGTGRDGNLRGASVWPHSQPLDATWLLPGLCTAAKPEAASAVLQRCAPVFAILDRVSGSGPTRR